MLCSRSRPMNMANSRLLPISSNSHSGSTRKIPYGKASPAGPHRPPAVDLRRQPARLSGVTDALVRNRVMSVRVEVKPELLAWARQRSGLGIDELARRFPKLREWEQGDRLPTLKQLEGCAQATHTP